MKKRSAKRTITLKHSSRKDDQAVLFVDSSMTDVAFTWWQVENWRNGLGPRCWRSARR